MNRMRVAMIGAVVLLSAGRIASAQTTGATLPAPTGRVAGPSVGVAAGATVEYCCPDDLIARLTGSLRVPLGSSISVEGEWSAPTTHEGHRLWSGGAHLLYHFGQAQLRPFLGAGMSFDRVSALNGAELDCFPRPPGGCEGVAFTGHLASGVDVAFGNRWSAFAAARIDDGVTPYAGVRLAITTRPAAAPAPEVRVTSATGGERRGRLVSQTAGAIVIRERSQEITLPAAEVRKVEKVTHRIRNLMLAGAVIGYVGGYLSSCGGGDENDCWPEAGLLFAGIGAGTGAMVGASVNRSARRDGRDVLFSAPPGVAASVSIAPVVTPARAGASVSLRW